MKGRRSVAILISVGLVACGPGDTRDSTPHRDSGEAVLPPDLDGDGFDEAVDCDDDDPEVNPGAAEIPYDGVDQDCSGADTTDVDGDGFDAEQTGGDDCDDNRSAVYPGADELCNELDDDCDGDVDEDAGTDTAWYQDADGDGWGYEWAPVQFGCEAPSGHVGVPGDCDDGDASINPAAIEQWYDGVDQDCDAHSDYDADLDGWDSEVELTGGMDCDDGDPAIFPFAEEVWYDGVDQDCDDASDYDQDGDGWDAEDYGGDDCDDEDGQIAPDALELCADGVDSDCDGVDGLAPCIFSLGDAHAKFTGVAASDQAGYSVAAAGDVNADGFDDILVGTPYEDSGGNSAGVAYLIHGPVTGTSSLSSAAAQLLGENASDYSAYALTGGVDTDGDGFDDLLVGAKNADAGGSNAGAAYLVLGPLTGVVGLSSAAALLLGSGSSDGAGSALAFAGDVDGDGAEDYFVGAPDYDGHVANCGAVYWVPGPIVGELSLGDTGLTMFGEDTNADTAEALSTAGDVDGDGLSDLLVGAARLDDNGTDSGAAYLVTGATMAGLSGSFELASADAKLLGSRSGDNAGSAVDGGHDVDGDGLDDLLIGAQQSGTVGAVFLVLGTVTGDVDLRDAQATLQGCDSYSYTGSTVAMVGDADGDSYGDMVVGAPYETSLSGYGGAAYLVYGPMSGTSSLSDAGAIWLGEASSDSAGGAVSSAGDVDADGFADFLVGAVGDDTGASVAGAAYLILGETR